MADLSAKKSDFITRQVQAVTTFMRTLDTLRALDDEHTNNGYGAGPNAIVDADAQGDNAHMDAALVNNVITSTRAIDAFMVSNFHDDVLAQAAR
jgi:hypothetical protein